jgi:hypothetical protein
VRLTRARIGQPMIKGRAPRSAPDSCVEAKLAFGGYDDNFEWTVTGPSGEEFPLFLPNIEPLWGDNSSAVSGLGSLYGWGASSIDVLSESPERWVRSSVAPSSGGQHLRVTSHSSTIGFVLSTAVMYLLGTRRCAVSNRVYSSVVGAGDIVSFSVQAKSSNTTDSPNLDLFIRFYSSAGTQLTNHPIVHPLTTSYTVAGTSAVASEVGFVLVGFAASTAGSTTVGVVIDADDATFEVA